MNSRQLKSQEQKLNNSLDLIKYSEIGGIGELTYRTVVFPNYELCAEDSGTYFLPVCTRYDTAKKKTDYSLTGKQLLVSLCELAKQLNSETSDASYLELISTWCIKNTHPYEIDSLCEILSDRNVDITTDGHFVSSIGIFTPEQFLHDLGELYNVTCFYAAFEALKRGNPVPAQNLYQEGRFFDGLPFFEPYKHDPPADTTWISETDPDDLIREMMRDTRSIFDRRPNGTFLHDPMDDYARLQSILLDLIPDFRMKLRVDPASKRIVFAADIQSVFDICWYTLSRVIASDAPAEDINPNGERPEGSLVPCANCGSFFIARNNRQRYCDDPMCQAARKRKNRRDCDDRKRQGLQK